MHDHSGPNELPQNDAADSVEWRALSRYIAGESTPDEASAVQSRLAAQRADAAFAELMKGRVADAFATGPRVNAEAAVDLGGAVDVERALAAVRARIAAQPAAVQPASVVPPAVSTQPALSVSRGGARGVGSRRWSGARGVVGLAAAAALTLTIGYGAWRGAGTPDAPGAGAADRGGMLASGARVYQTPVGVRDSVVLADGSRVMLAPGSRLTVPADFGAARSVDLEGAAFFVVVHDAAHPFTVRSRGTETRDVGTAFSVNTDALGGVTVAVTEGVVSMRTTAAPSATPVELKAGDRGVAQGVSGEGDGYIAVSRGIVTPEDVAWTHGELSYRDAPLATVQGDLQRWYGITLAVTDSALRRQTLKMSFAGDTPQTAVQKIALALGAEIVTRGDTVYLAMPSRAATP